MAFAASFFSQVSFLLGFRLFRCGLSLLGWLFRLFGFFGLSASQLFYLLSYPFQFSKEGLPGGHADFA